MSLNQNLIVVRLYTIHRSPYKISLERANCIIRLISEGASPKTIFPLSLCQCKKNVRYRCYDCPLAGKRGAIWNATARWEYTGEESLRKPPCGNY